MNQRRAYRSFVSYIDRSREYYAAQGYSQPYAWACHDDAPFTPLKKPLSECRVGLVTTAGRIDADLDKQGRRKVKELYAMEANPAPKRMFTADLAWDNFNRFVTVPEPGTLALLVLGVGCLLRRRPR